MTLPAWLPRLQPRVTWMQLLPALLGVAVLSQPLREAGHLIHPRHPEQPRDLGGRPARGMAG